jgi:adenine-specific DNA-methyltransferase
MMKLTAEDKAQIKGCIDRGEPLPGKYRHALFAEPHEAELIWPGKTHEVTSIVLPFQSIEQIDEPRAESAAQSDLFQMDSTTGRQTGGWTNKLIWGDNKLVLSSLKNGPLRREIDNAGGLKLIYIDPPFDVGADFSFDVEVGDLTLKKEPSVIEEVAYRDTWGRGKDSYYSMVFERLSLIRDLMASSGSIYVHCDWRLNSAMRIIMDEIFGSTLFLGEIKWKRVVSSGSSKSISKKYPVVDDSILFYTKSADYFWSTQFLPYSDEYQKRFTERDKRGAFYWDNLSTYSDETLARLIAEDRIKLPLKPGKNPRYKNYLHEGKGTVVDNLWVDIPSVNSQAVEDTGYATQKPEKLLERILLSSSAHGDLIADFDPRAA